MKYTTDKQGNPLFFAEKHKSVNYAEDSKKYFPSSEDIACELQLLSLGNWEQLRFKINGRQWKKDEEELKHWYKPFQPKENILNDRESILLYGMEGDLPTEPTGLSQVKRKYGYKPKESEFKYPTEAKDKLICCEEIFNYFDDWGRCFIIKLNAGGFYPYHRDHYFISRDTIRLVAFLGDSTDGLEWEVSGQRMRFTPNSLYYVNTIRLHRLSAWYHNCTMVVFNLVKNWYNITKLMSMIRN